MWEVRVYLGDHPVSGEPRQRSVTVHGDQADAEQRRALLAQQAEQLRARAAVPLGTVADVLAVWLAAEHDWKPSTQQNYRHATRRLSAEPVARRRPDRLSPPVLCAAMAAWQQQEVRAATIALHVRTLRAALDWAFERRLIASQPLLRMRGPVQPAPRRDVPLTVVRRLLTAAADDVTAAQDAEAGDQGTCTTGSSTSTGGIRRGRHHHQDRAAAPRHCRGHDRPAVALDPCPLATVAATVPAARTLDVHRPPRPGPLGDHHLANAPGAGAISSSCDQRPPRLPRRVEPRGLAEDLLTSSMPG